MKMRKMTAAVLAAVMFAATPAMGALLSPFSVTASAEDTLTEGDYSYTVNEDGETVTITKYTGTDSEVDIPRTLDGKAVTVIGDKAFYKCISLTNITIPDSVTEIGYSSFEECTSLTGLTIPDGVTTISTRAFYGCRSLKSVVIPDSVTEIFGVAFCGCSSLESVSLSNNLTEIMISVFSCCRSLKSVAIPDGVTEISNMAFDNCKALTSVTIPSSVTKISINAFDGDTNLMDVYYGESKSQWEKISISSGNDSLINATIHFAKEDEPDTSETEELKPGDVFEDGDLQYLVLVDGTLEVEGFASEKLKETVKELIIPNEVKGKKVSNLISDAFANCTSLISVTIPNSIKVISSDAFRNCTSLTSVTIPDGVRTIDEYAFQCTALTSVTIPNSVMAVDDSAFTYCASLERFIVSESNENYSSVDGVLFNKDKTLLILYPEAKKNTLYTIPDSVAEISRGAFYKCTFLTNVIIPDSVTEIGDMAFDGCVSLTGVTISNNIMTISKQAFHQTALTSVTIPDCVTIIGNLAFADCYYLTNVIIPNNVTKIDAGAFENSHNITSITIPNSVKVISELAFEYCTSLEVVNYSGTRAEWEAIEIGDFNDYLTNAEIICTDGIINEREPDTSESTSSDTCEPTSSDTSASTTSDTSEPTSSDTSEPTPSDTSEPEDLQPGDYFVDGDLEYTVLKDGTLEIRGFAGDETKEIIIPETVKGKKVTSIGDAAFMDCTSLTNITLPDSVTKIGGYAFSGCTSLETVNYSGRKSGWEAIEIDIENEPLINAEIKFAEQTVEIVDEDTNVKAEISTEDKELDGAEFEANPADHPTLWDLIKKIIEKAVDTVESVTEEAQKSLEEAAEAVKNGKGFAYDMGFKKNGKEVQPDKSVTVSVPVPEKFKNDIDKLNVYHLTGKGAVYVPSWIKDGSIMFKTHSFSPYVITTEKLANAVADETENNTPTVPSKKPSGSDQQPTGIALAIAPAVLAAGAVIVIFKKRK